MENRFFVGLDLGQSQDFTAISIVERIAADAGALEATRYRYGSPIPKLKAQPRFECRHLQRLPLGTLYPAIVQQVKQMLDSPELEGRAQLVVDATGVGRPVVDMLRAAGLEPKAITITGGDTVSTEGGFTRVPKRELVSILQVTLQDKRLGFAESLPDLPTLISEMMAFKVKITAAANDTYGAWREGAHDDLVLAVALAVWEASRNVGTTFCFPAYEELFGGTF